MHISANQIQLQHTFRARLAAALHSARHAAYREGEYVGQESFVTAYEILSLASAAGVTDRAWVLDVCCGTGGPALYLAQEIGCRMVGLDRSAEAIYLAQAAAESHALAHSPRFFVADACQLPLNTSFDAVLLIETMLAIADKVQLLQEISRVLPLGGRFGFTLETGEPLSPAEQACMPEGDQIWLLPESELTLYLELAGFQVCQIEDRTAVHADVAQRLVDAFRNHHAEIAAVLGSQRSDQIVAAHLRWVEWLATRRVRKLAFVVERVR